MTTCRHCARPITLIEGEWTDPNATGDDSMWALTCPDHDSFVADHEPEPLCHRCGVTIPDGQEQWAMADRLCPGCFDA